MPSVKKLYEFYTVVPEPNVLMGEQVDEDKLSFTISDNPEKDLRGCLKSTLTPSEAMNAKSFEIPCIPQNPGCRK